MVVLTAAVILSIGKRRTHRPLWPGIFIVLVVEMAQITPPVGFNLFVLQGMTGKDIFYIGARSAVFLFHGDQWSRSSEFPRDRDLPAATHAGQELMRPA